MAKKISVNLYKHVNVIKAWGDIPSKLWRQSPTVACPQRPYIKRSARRGPCASSPWSLGILHQNLGLEGSLKLKNMNLDSLWPASLLVTSCDQFLVTKFSSPKSCSELCETHKNEEKILTKFYSQITIRDLVSGSEGREHDSRPETKSLIVIWL